MSFRTTLCAGLVSAALANSAHAAIKHGDDDPVTGWGWIKATTLAEGQALGYRAASTAEFSAYLQHSGYVGPSNNGEYYRAGSAGIPRALLGFSVDLYLPSATPYDFGDPRVIIGWLDGSTEQVGAALYTSGTFFSIECPTDPNGCFYTVNVMEAAHGSLQGMVAGQHDNLTYAMGGDWVSALQALREPDGSYALQYFMVAVPEPSAWALAAGGLGIAAVSAHRRRRVART